jgi:hypothetical protein
MKLYKKELHYLDDHLFDIAICDVTISFIETKYRETITKNPKLLSKYQKDIPLTNCLLILDKDNMVPTKQIHDRKIKTFLRDNNVKIKDDCTYWMSKITKVKDIGDTIQQV